jgi:hypothetical protein
VNRGSMQRTALALLGGTMVLLLAAACSDKTPLPGPSATEVPLEVSMSEGGPPAFISDELAISARELLARSDAAMRAVEYLRVYEAMDAAPGPSWWFTIYETLASDTIVEVAGFSLEELGGELTWTPHRPARDRDRFTSRPHFLLDRLDGRLGAEHLLPQTFQAQRPRVIGEDRIDGRPTWVLWYSYSFNGFEGLVTKFVTEWIDKETLLLMRQQTNNLAPYESTEGIVRLVYAVNDRDAPLVAPVELPQARLEPHTRVVRFPASADAALTSGAPDENFGAAQTLSARDGDRVMSLLRFEIDELPAGGEVRGAWLGVYGTPAAGELLDYLYPAEATPRLGTVHRVEGPWAEGEVTRSGAPAVGSRVAELISVDGVPRPEPGPVEAGWMIADVSAAVRRTGRHDFYLLNESDLLGTSLSSREGEHPPVLIVTYEYTVEPPIPLPTP